VTDETPNPIAPEPEPNPIAPEPPTSRPGRAVSSAETRPRRPDYRGEELDPERGPGLGCFWFQVIVLGFFIVLIPIGLELNWPFELLAFLLFVVIGLLLLTGQSVIFLLRLVAADRRSQGRRRPLASSTKTVGELEDERQAGPAPAPAVHPDSTADAGPGDAPADSSRDSESMNRELEVAETPPTEANAPVSAAADPDVDAAGTDAGDGAASRTDAGDGVPAVATGGGDEVAAAVRAHESSPESHETGAIRTADAGVPSTDEGAAAPAADADVDGDAPLPDALPDLPPDEASPEEPDPGVRQ
jgi:hypothetical protein